MKRRLSALLLLTLVIALSLGNRSAAQAQSPVTIRFSSFQSGDVVKFWDKQFADFEAKTGIKVVQENVPWDQTVEKYLTMAAGGDLPDVSMISAQWLRALASRGIFHAFKQDELPSLKLDDFWPNLLNAYKYDGKQYGLPTDLDLALTFYNKDLFDAAGVPYPTPGWTWDDYRATAAKLTKGDGTGKIYGSASFDFGHVRMIAWSYGGDWLDKDGKVATFDSAPVRKAMDVMNALYVTDKSAPAPGVQGVDMTNGRVAMGVYGPWAAYYFFKDAKFKWDAVKAPKGTQDAVLAWGSALGISESSKNKEAALKFVEFFLSPDNQFQRASDWAWFPPGKAATDKPGFLEDKVLNATTAQKKVVIDSVAFGQAPLVQKDEAKLSAVFDQEIGLVAGGSKTMDQAIKDIQSAWEAILQQ